LRARREERAAFFLGEGTTFFLVVRSAKWLFQITLKIAPGRADPTLDSIKQLNTLKWGASDGKPRGSSPACSLVSRRAIGWGRRVLRAALGSGADLILGRSSGGSI